MTREEAKEKVGEGWSGLVEHFFDMVEQIDPTAIVDHIGRRSGMLDIKANSDGDVIINEIFDRLSWSLERDSATVCEVCGKRGYRRKILPGNPNRCNVHYYELFNKYMNEGGIPDEEVQD